MSVSISVLFRRLSDLFPVVLLHPLVRFAHDHHLLFHTDTRGQIGVLLAFLSDFLGGGGHGVISDGYCQKLTRHSATRQNTETTRRLIGDLWLDDEGAIRS